MPWVGNEGVGVSYCRLTWWPPVEEMDLALQFAYDLGVGGVEYEDGDTAQSPFTDIPLAAGAPFVRVYAATSAGDQVVERVRERCRERSWPLEEQLVESQDWANAWKAYYQPEHLPGGYTIVPAWDESPRDARYTLWMDPGMAFGTGSHPTTKTCLMLLANLPLAGQRVLDLGAGSGILGLFAARRGAGAVVMVEPDPVAVDAIFHNARLNHLEQAVSVVPGTLTDLPTRPFDIIVVNIIWEIIAAEWQSLTAYRATSSTTMILSGLLPSRRQAVMQLVSATGQRVDRMLVRDGWLTVVVRA